MLCGETHRISLVSQSENELLTRDDREYVNQLEEDLTKAARKVGEAKSTKVGCTFTHRYYYLLT
jgi:hypothetical protein